MATRGDTPPALTREQHSALFHELGALWQRVYDCPLDCFCGSDEDLIRTVQDLRQKAAGIDDQERE